MAKGEDPTAPRDDDPQCENGDGRAVAIFHDNDGGKHFLCGGCAWRRQQDAAGAAAEQALEVGQ